MSAGVSPEIPHYTISYTKGGLNFERNSRHFLIFPSPKILYLYEDGNAPAYHELTIRFGGQQDFVYRVPTFSYLKMDPRELNRRKLIVLIPFQLLRLRKAIEKERTPENLNQLKNLIQDDIIGSIKENIAAGNITKMEGQKLQQITLLLYQHIYQKYDEAEKAGVNQMAEEALILEIDIIEEQLTKKLTKELTEKITEKVTGEITKKLTDEITEKLTDEITEKLTDEITGNLAERLRRRGFSEDDIQSLLNQ